MFGGGGGGGGGGTGGGDTGGGETGFFFLCFFLCLAADLSAVGNAARMLPSVSEPNTRVTTRRVGRSASARVSLSKRPSSINPSGTSCCPECSLSAGGVKTQGEKSPFLVPAR